MIKNFLAVGMGGAIGAMLRYGAGLVGTALGWSSNLSTFLVNAIGSFVMGLLVSSCEQGTWLLLASVGLCGGFTTFSSFSMQAVTLLQQGKWGMFAIYVSATLVICILMAWFGFSIGAHHASGLLEKFQHARDIIVFPF